MLQRLALKDVGPSSSMTLDLASRLNLITGDNGLGKTFLLDVAWWALTGVWAAEVVAPQGQHPEIQLTVLRTEPVTRTATFDFVRQGWRFTDLGLKMDLALTPSGDLAVANGDLLSIDVALRNARPSVVVYARVDGGFAIWDAFRNMASVRPELFRFTPEQVWNGLSIDGNPVCNGIIIDWVKWQASKTPSFERLSQALQTLSEGTDLDLSIGEPTRVSVKDVRDIPTLVLPYGPVPVTQLSAAVRRVAALAYLLVWAWDEHIQAAHIRRQPPGQDMVLLFDEVETHLHPRWQRAILPAVMRVVQALRQEGQAQVVAATHAPLILASVETIFDEAQDRLFHLYLGAQQAQVEEVPWAKRGDVDAWLESDLFGLRQARSRDAERIIEIALQFMRGEQDQLPGQFKTYPAITAELRRVLPDMDPFWPRWIVEEARHSA